MGRFPTSRQFRRFRRVATALAVTASACSTSLTPVSNRPQLIQEPAIGETRKAEIGETLVQTRREVRIAALYISDPIIANGTSMRAAGILTIRAGTLMARYVDGASTCYVATELATLRSYGADEHVEAAVCVDLASSDSTRVITTSNGALFAPKSPIRFERQTVVDRTAPAFSQELVYNGRAGNVVKFLYREFASETARPAFNQDVQYDLTEGRVVGFKNARIEILEATNTSLTYRVLAHFPPPAT